MEEKVHTEGTEEVFDLTIRNGAGKQLRELMTHYKIDNAKDLVALSLSLLEKVKGSKVIVERPGGTSIELTIGINDNAKHS